MINNELLKTEQVAQMTGYAVGYIYQLVHKREIPYIKLNGRGLRFIRADIAAWINSYRTGAQPGKEVECLIQDDYTESQTAQSRRFNPVGGKGRWQAAQTTKNG